jgi:large subunit ribosomal protein L6
MHRSDITVKGKFGTLQTKVPSNFITQDGSQLKVIIKEQTRNVRALHGLYRTLINNMVVGVSEQFDLTLTLKGVGYRATVQGEEIVLSLGYSHPVKMNIPKKSLLKLFKIQL